MCRQSPDPSLLPARPASRPRSVEAGKGPVLHLADVDRCYFQEAALSLHLVNALSDSSHVLLFLAPRETQTRLSPGGS